VNARSFDGSETPLAVASREGHCEVARALLEHGADMEIRNNHSYSPVEHASTKGHVKVVQVLIECGADVNKGMDRRNNTILHLASSSGHPNVARMSLEHGAHVHAMNIDNSNPPAFGTGRGGCSGAPRVRRKSECPGQNQMNSVAWSTGSATRRICTCTPR
jgi:ankyrin repeat protein